MLVTFGYSMSYLEQFQRENGIWSMWHRNRSAIVSRSFNCALPDCRVKRKQEGEKGSGSAAVALLQHQMKMGPGTPPDTPRLGDQPLTARVLADRAAPLWPEGLPMPSARVELGRTSFCKPKIFLPNPT